MEIIRTCKIVRIDIFSAIPGYFSYTIFRFVIVAFESHPGRPCDFSLLFRIKIHDSGQLSWPVNTVYDAAGKLRKHGVASCLGQLIQLTTAVAAPEWKP
ncbi:hypothetical protein CEXT_261571 [Caerostris extrusa]|uniref:Uncharacterized protein n=1 Tax=Caerostris extrusa TaxID=172846 RepID=A0AAV4SQX9_CAEEX|nr:hypothetical protein CEXT_261571 [Caerostris extrusa]